jgi:hypothetical protein
MSKTRQSGEREGALHLTIRLQFFKRSLSSHVFDATTGIPRNEFTVRRSILHHLLIGFLFQFPSQFELGSNG